MPADLLTFPNADEEVAIPADEEPAIAAESDEPTIEAESEPAIPTVEPVALAALPFVEVLPADFKLPTLIKFVPNPALRVAADQAGTYALGLKVDGAEGLQAADVALAAVRASLKAITETFEEPTSIAYALHKRLTAMRGEWCERGQQAIETVGKRMYTENKRLEAIAAEERRKAQAEADRKAKEDADRAAKAAEAAQAPAAVVETMKQQAKTTTAPPVSVPTFAPPALKGNAPVAKWKARIIGTPGDVIANPDVTELSEAQRGQVFTLLRAIVEGKAPLAAITLNWSYLNKRASADKSTFLIPGLEAFDEGGIRGKSTRSQ